MGIGTARDTLAQLARLDAAAERAGCALACPHQSAEEFHSALIRNYLSLHPPRHPYAFAAAVIILAVLFVVV